jgi:hypothetical protein
MKVSQIVRNLIHDDPNNVERSKPYLDIDVANNYADYEIGAQDFIYGNTTLVFSGPPLLRQAIKEPDYIFQVGVTTSMNISQNRAYIPWDEFGYAYTRSIPSKVQNSITMGKMHTTSGNLLAALYRWLVRFMIQSKDDTRFKAYPGAPPTDDLNQPTEEAVPLLSAYQNQLMNMGSELFCIPFGLLIIQLDGNFDIQTTRYAERCKIPVYTEAIGADSPVIQESTQLACTRILPATGLTVSTRAKSPYILPGPEDPIRTILSITADRIKDYIRTKAYAVIDNIPGISDETRITLKRKVNEALEAAEDFTNIKEIERIITDILNVGTFGGVQIKLDLEDILQGRF